MAPQRLKAVLPVSFKHATLSAFQYARRFPRDASDISGMMQLWMEAASAVPYTDNVGGSVVVGLLNMASIDRLLSHIPVVAWDWLNKLPVIPAECAALLPGPTKSVVQTIQQLGSVKLIALYLCIIWSEERKISSDGFSAMGRLIREELGGIGAAGYRKDLIRRLDCVLSQLDLRQARQSLLGNPWDPTVRGYEKLREELLEIDREATKILTGTSSTELSPLLRPLTSVCRISFRLHVRTPSSVPVVAFVTRRSFLRLSMNHYHISKPHSLVR